MARKAPEPKRFTIPSGKILTDVIKSGDVDIEEMVLNWLKGCRNFEHLTFSFSKNPEAYDLNKTRAITFDDSGELPIWTTHRDGKEFLAKELAPLLRQSMVKFEVQKDGVFIFTDKKKKFTPASEDWEPYIEFQPSRKPGYSA